MKLKFPDPAAGGFMMENVKGKPQRIHRLIEVLKASMDVSHASDDLLPGHVNAAINSKHAAYWLSTRANRPVAISFHTFEGQTTNGGTQVDSGRYPKICICAGFDFNNITAANAYADLSAAALLIQNTFPAIPLYVVIDITIYTDFTHDRIYTDIFQPRVFANNLAANEPQQQGVFVGYPEDYDQEKPRWPDKIKSWKLHF